MSTLPVVILGPARELPVVRETVHLKVDIALQEPDDEVAR